MTQQKRSRRRNSLIALLLALLFAYVASYAWFYSNRGPAANLAYFAYLPDAERYSDSEEMFLYDFYLPIYKLHRWLFHVGPHVFDSSAYDRLPDDMQ